MIIEYIKKIYNWYYYVQVKCYSCGKVIFIDKNNYIDIPNNSESNIFYSCGNSCSYKSNE